MIGLLRTGGAKTENAGRRARNDCFSARVYFLLFKLHMKQFLKAHRVLISLVARFVQVSSLPSADCIRTEQIRRALKIIIIRDKNGHHIICRR